MSRAGVRWLRFTLFSGEWRLCCWCNRWCAEAPLNALFTRVSRLGDGPFWYALIACLPLLAGSDGALAAVHMAVTGALTAVLYRWLKHWTRRPRPFRQHDGIVAHIPPLDEFSFPSGHTLHAVSFSTVALAWLPWLWPLLLPFTALVAVSRVMLGLHYPSDVLVAIALGCGIGQAVLALTPYS